MKKFHPFFGIGTFGIIVIACLHLLLSLVLAITSSHTIFFALYPIFLTFLILGFVITIKGQKTPG